MISPHFSSVCSITDAVYVVWDIFSVINHMVWGAFATGATEETRHFSHIILITWNILALACSFFFCHHHHFLHSSHILIKPRTELTTRQSNFLCIKKNLWLESRELAYICRALNQGVVVNIMRLYLLWLRKSRSSAEVFAIFQGYCAPTNSVCVCVCGSSHLHFFQ